MCLSRRFVFFFHDTTPTEIYTLSLHDALPISLTLSNLKLLRRITRTENILHRNLRSLRSLRRSEERFSRNAETELVCRLLLEKKKQLTRQSESMPKASSIFRVRAAMSRTRVRW